MYSSCYIQELRALHLDALLSNAVNIVNYAAVQLAVTRDVPIYIHLLFCKKKKQAGCLITEWLPWLQTVALGDVCFGIED